MRADPVDTTGAGDVFATAFILALGEGEATAARLAAAYAAAKVEVVGPAPLPDRSTIERRLSDG
jgi:sugar/nucleoside kinase (ribokinase family)